MISSLTRVHDNSGLTGFEYFLPVYLDDFVYNSVKLPGCLALLLGVQYGRYETLLFVLNVALKFYFL